MDLAHAIQTLRKDLRARYHGRESMVAVKSRRSGAVAVRAMDGNMIRSCIAAIRALSESDKGQTHMARQQIQFTADENCRLCDGTGLTNRSIVGHTTCDRHVCECVSSAPLRKRDPKKSHDHRKARQ
jgi:hypothetical protein